MEVLEIFHSGSCARHREVKTSSNSFLSPDPPAFPLWSPSLDTQRLRELTRTRMPPPSSCSSLPARVGNHGHLGGLNALWITHFFPLFCLTSIQVPPRPPQNLRKESSLLTTCLAPPCSPPTTPILHVLSSSAQPLSGVGLDAGGRQGYLSVDRGTWGEGELSQQPPP